MAEARHHHDDSAAAQDRSGGTVRRGRTLSRILTLVVTTGVAVVGVAGAASAHHNTISGTVACRTGGGWDVTWSVVNSEQITETITASNRTGAVPVGSTLAGGQTRTFGEAVGTKPSSPLTLTLSARWSNNVTATNSGSIAVAAFSDACAKETVVPPSVPVVDECGPDNAHYGEVPAGPWSVTRHPDGSLTVTADGTHQFPGGQTSVTYPAPVDSDAACPTPPTPPATPPATPPTTTPPATTPPEVLPAEVRVVRARARKLDKCGRASDLYKVARRSGVVYKVRGKVVREGVWLKARTRTVTVRAFAVDAGYRLEGSHRWRLRFTRRACAPAPEVAPHTGQ